MEARLDEATAEMLKLFPGLYKEEATGRRELDRDTFARVTSPHVQTGIPRTSMNGEEVEVGVETGKDSVFLPVLLEIGSSGCKQVWAEAHFSDC